MGKGIAIAPCRLIARQYVARRIEAREVSNRLRIICHRTTPGPNYSRAALRVSLALTGRGKRLTQVADYVSLICALSK